MKNKSTPPVKTDETSSTASDDASKIESDIEKTRASMSDTIDQLHGKLNPGVLKDQALDQFQQAKEAIKSDVRSEIEDVKGLLLKELADAKTEFRAATIGKVEHMVDDAQQTVTETSNNLMTAIRENPIPAALVGIGIGWLFINARARGSRSGGRRTTTSGSFVSNGRRQVEDAARQVGQRANRLLHSAEDQTKQALDKATDGVETLAHDASGSVSEFAGRAKSTALSVAHDARDTAVQWEGTVERTLRENPLPLGAIALALGVAAGLAIPSTRIEDQWVGEYRDRAVDEAEVLAQQALGNIESGAKQLAENAKSTDHQPA
ncbi:MAG: DUF3618 domain-containing protein [Polyangiaceae bacterium]